MKDSQPAFPDRDALMAAVAAKYARVAAVVDGRSVGETIDNTGSVSGTLDDYDVLAGVREIPMAAFDQLDGPVTFYSASEEARTRALAEAIQQSGRIDPLIVVEDGEGPYVLEGGHRFDALRLLGARAFPAMVVLDTADLLKRGVHALPASATRKDFAAFFRASQLVDQDGMPLMLFHGSNQVFDALAPSGSGNMGSGLYLTTSARASGVFGYRASLRDESSGPVSLPFYVRVEKLLNVDVLKPSDIANLRRAIPRTPDGLVTYGAVVSPTDMPFWQADLDKLHADLDRGLFSPVRLSGMFMGTGQEVEVLGRLYAAAGYDAIGRTGDALKNEATYFEVVVFQSNQLEFAIPAMAEAGRWREQAKAAPYTYYGTIEAKDSDRTLLASMGVELWRYDHDGGRFYACYEPDVHAVLQEHRSDFVVRTTAVPRVAELTVFHADQAVPGWLPQRQAYVDWQIKRDGHVYTGRYEVERRAIAQALGQQAPGPATAVALRDDHPALG